jgi:catechol 2,3-dioxygenase-like lactoylglutathione lyase family enzyme
MATSVTATLTTGFNHVAVITRDLDRCAAFWHAVLDAGFTELADPRGRHGFVELGAPGMMSVLHAFEVPEGVTGPHPPGPMMRRGRIDHLAIGAADEAALVEIRDRLVTHGASDGSIRLFAGELLSIHGTDPDGMEFEVACPRSGDLLGDDDIEVVP